MMSTYGWAVAAGRKRSSLSKPLPRTSNGRTVAEMPNYWLGATGRYYFPGLYTAVLPMIPGIYAIVWLAGLRTRGMNDRVQAPRAS
jgi:hypothetical protein